MSKIGRQARRLFVLERVQEGVTQAHKHTLTHINTLAHAQVGINFAYQFFHVSLLWTSFANYSVISCFLVHSYFARARLFRISAPMSIC